MSLPRQKLFARSVLVVFALACGTWLLRLDPAEKVSTDVLELLPPAEQSAEVAIVRNLANDVQARAMLFALQAPASPPTASAAPPSAGSTENLAATFSRALLRSGVFVEALAPADPASRDALGAAIFERRFKLLLPSWLGENERAFNATGRPRSEFSPWTANRAAEHLEAFLARPEASAMEKLLVADPLLLVPRLVTTWSNLTPPTPDAHRALVWARLRVSPLSDAGQGPAFAAIDAALAEVRQSHPGVELQWTGVNRFASASRERIQQEITWLNALSLLAVLLVAFGFIRRPWQAAHLVPVILLALLGAWTASTLVFERVHVLVFVIGALLTGVAIDYGFYIALQPALYPSETYLSKLRRLFKPLLVSCLTTTIGFSLLLFSDLPLLRQIGLFVGAGLLTALAAAMLYFAQLDTPQIATRTLPLLDRGRFRSSRVPVALLLLALVVAATTPFRAQWRDDIRDLEIASPELRANDRALRQLFGESSERVAFLTHGPTLAEARDNLQRFLYRIAQQSPDANPVSLGAVFPTADDWRSAPRRLQDLDTFEPEFRRALEERGFDAGSFELFFQSWRQHHSTASDHPDYVDLYRDLSTILRGPLAQMMRIEGSMPWFLTLAPAGSASPLPPEFKTLPVNQLESLNQLFGRYRWTALRLSLIGLGFVIVSVFVVYRGLHGVRIALIPIGACFFVLGIFSFLDRPLNLFHLLGGFLGVCLSHNYAIFSDDTHRRRSLPPPAIRLSALTTAASFGVLGFSQIPVIHALGATVACIVITTLAAIELEARAPARS